ncbi:MAG: hypothetical protein QGG23_05090 [Candidatus Bathyarchaeota archaeon]|nr:hypothetical protein [Candidatus Bathyarchaeota archaeon]MDP7443375.1 hypothetical protein [Candidatus Bathyarchaeota archaeon]
MAEFKVWHARISKTELATVVDPSLVETEMVVEIESKREILGG